MRQIKFRGRINYLEWAYGDLETCPLSLTAKIHQYNDDGTYKGQVKVDRSTVGQFTGLLDKDGKEIYEGDILALQETDNKVTHCPVSMNCKGYWSIDFGINYGVCLGLVDKKRVEVIGNIYDNENLSGSDNTPTKM